MLKKIIQTRERVLHMLFAGLNSRCQNTKQLVLSLIRKYFGVVSKPQANKWNGDMHFIALSKLLSLQWGT